MSKTAQSHIALLAVNVIYGVNFLVAKGLMPGLIGPSGFIVIRVLGATIMFWILWLFWYREKITNRKDLMLLALCGVFGVVVNQLLFFNGLCITSPINGSIIMVSSPILVLVISAALISEKITGTRLAGVIIGSGGAIALILSRSGSLNDQSSLAGDLMIFVNALSYAIYLVLVKPLMQKYKPLTVISYVFLFGLPLVMVFGWKEFMAVNWQVFTVRDIIGVSFVVVFVTFLAYLLNTFALKYVTASVSSVYIYVQPLVTTALMVLLAHFGNGAPADLTYTKIFCGFLIFWGVYLASRPSAPTV